MRNLLVAIIASFTAIALPALNGVSAEDAQATPIDYTKVSPVELVKSTPKGKLMNPYKDTQADGVAQGGKLFQSYSCSGCHGGGGGGGMGPALTNDTWIYGGDDDTLFRLIVLGSDALQKNGYSRVGHENVVGPMAPFGALIKNSDDLWKMLAFIRSKYSGDPTHKLGMSGTRGLNSAFVPAIVGNAEASAPFRASLPRSALEHRDAQQSSMAL
jgi:mono/diheme cytochrome c family protein